MNATALAILGDEATHAGQILNGELGFYSEKNQIRTSGYDYTDEIESKQGSVNAVHSNGLSIDDVGGSASRYYDYVIRKGGNAYEWIQNDRNSQGLTYANPNYKAFAKGGKGKNRIKGSAIPSSAKSKLYFSKGKLNQ